MNPEDIQAPASPLGNFPELANMYRSSFQLPLSNANVNAKSADAAVSVANAKSASSASNYQQVQRSDGGYAFIDPSGKEITADQYAAATGKTPADVLAKSQNPVDLQYLQDFNNLQTLGKAISTGDQATIKAYNAKQPALKGMNYDQLVSHFKQAYPTVYGGGGFQGAGTAGQKLGSTFVPTVSKTSSPLDALLAQYGIGQ